MSDSVSELSKINTTKRNNKYCLKKAKDGRVCSLYLNHFGDHKEKHLKSSWSDDET